MTAGAGAGSTGPSDTAGPLFELPPELAIDTGVARRVMAGFIRNQLHQAGFGRALWGCRVASTRPWSPS